MAESCPDGSEWDILVKTCVHSSTGSRQQPDPPIESPMTAVDQLTATAATTEVDSVFVWLLVCLATVGSILALALWLIIYRRQSRLSSTPGDAASGQERLHTPAKAHPWPSEGNGRAESQRAAEAPSRCHHLHLGAQAGSEWEAGFTACRGPAKHAGTEGGGGLPACSARAEHRIPLPATELGGTALVTTKTV